MDLQFWFCLGAVRNAECEVPCKAYGMVVYILVRSLGDSHAHYSIVCFLVLGIESWAFYRLSKCSTTEVHLQS
jgi:hypothetical protein